jgi:hypothetical protein
MNEKRERFKRVATRRTNAILKKLQTLGHCANKSAYEYTDEEVNKIFAEIEKATKLTRMKFQLRTKTKEFKL